MNFDVLLVVGGTLFQLAMICGLVVGSNYGFANWFPHVLMLRGRHRALVIFLLALLRALELGFACQIGFHLLVFGVRKREPGLEPMLTVVMMIIGAADSMLIEFASRRLLDQAR